MSIDPEQEIVTITVDGEMTIIRTLTYTNNTFAISNDGKLFGRKQKGPHKTIGEWSPRHTIETGKYIETWLPVHGPRRKTMLHRAVFEAWQNNGARLPSSTIISHIDDNGKNNNIINLRRSTRSENTKEAYKNGKCIQPKDKKNKIYSLNNENIKPILWLPGKYADKYAVSSTGIVFSRKMVNGEYKWVERLSQINAMGYVTVNLSIDGAPMSCLVARLVASVWKNNGEKIPANRFVDHMDHNKLNNDTDNLQIITPSYNVIRAFLNGRMNGHQKIPKEQVLEVVSIRRSKKISHTKISQQTGIEIHNVSAILSGRTGSHYTNIRKQFAPVHHKRPHSRIKKIIELLDFSWSSRPNLRFRELLLLVMPNISSLSDLELLEDDYLQRALDEYVSTQN